MVMAIDSLKKRTENLEGGNKPSGMTVLNIIVACNYLREIEAAKNDDDLTASKAKFDSLLNQLNPGVSSTQLKSIKKSILKFIETHIPQYRISKSIIFMIT